MRFLSRQIGQWQTGWRQCCQPAFCFLLTIWMLLTTVGFSTGPLKGSSGGVGTNVAHNCCCAIQKQQSKNCCCHPGTSDDAAKSCCSGVSEKNSEQDDDEPVGPQINSYCGTPVSDGMIISREPRLDTDRFSAKPVFHVEEFIAFQDESFSNVLHTIEPPPPRV